MANHHSFTCDGVEYLVTLAVPLSQTGRTTEPSFEFICHEPGLWSVGEIIIWIILGTAISLFLGPIMLTVVMGLGSLQEQAMLAIENWYDRLGRKTVEVIKRITTVVKEVFKSWTDQTPLPEQVGFQDVDRDEDDDDAISCHTGSATMFVVDTMESTFKSKNNTLFDPAHAVHAPWAQRRFPRQTEGSSRRQVNACQGQGVGEQRSPDMRNLEFEAPVPSYAEAVAEEKKVTEK
ncbi:hypothetical protein EDD11_007492 [Mortierella claussenii]|nr:hypothetical protein EDD11_007492 [Mortierella claussenii]